jgi:hypothetical protein
MLRTLLRCVAALSTLLPLAALGEPIHLKLSFVSSDRTVLYRAAVKPFVNAEGKGVPVEFVRDVACDEVQGF